MRTRQTSLTSARLWDYFYVLLYTDWSPICESPAEQFRVQVQSATHELMCSLCKNSEIVTFTETKRDGSSLGWTGDMRDPVTLQQRMPAYHGRLQALSIALYVRGVNDAAETDSEAEIWGLPSVGQKLLTVFEIDTNPLPTSSELVVAMQEALIIDTDDDDDELDTGYDESDWSDWTLSTDGGSSDEEDTFEAFMQQEEEERDARDADRRQANKFEDWAERIKHADPEMQFRFESTYDSQDPCTMDLPEGPPMFIPQDMRQGAIHGLYNPRSLWLVLTSDNPVSPATAQPFAEFDVLWATSCMVAAVKKLPDPPQSKAVLSSPGTGLSTNQ